ncbi:phosphatidic acid phosphatase type [Thelotrema lepadinum]|nr:phosphatidic acid phosphatase type [Thelotrema lepadinum]
MPVSKRRIFSYVLDWIFILIIAAAGGAIYQVRGTTHAFSLTDPNISYPLYPDTVSITVAAVVSLVVPAVVIAAFSLLVKPEGWAANSESQSRWRYRLWQWNAGWLGLGLAVVGAFFFTSGVKAVVGKPRPNLIARCQPDLSQITRYAVSGLGQSLEEAPTLVSAGICRNPDQSVIQDGFASYPSGHSSFAFAGFMYFTLWLCAKLAVAVPDFLPGQKSTLEYGKERSDAVHGPRYSPAAPPIYLLVLAFIPFCSAAYIAASRWADNQHAGWDILSGSVIGIFFGWLGFRWYFPSLQSLRAVSWAPRSESRAFYGGLGSGDFGDTRSREDDPESGAP